MKIWAHRGLSLKYPENTITAFREAMSLKGLTGIELDIGITKDNYMVVCHDDTVDRTTYGKGLVKSFNLKEIKELKINCGNEEYEYIPTIEEVIDLLYDKLKTGLLLNIELKESMLGYEQKIIDLVHRRGIEKSVIYSSFYAKIIENIKKLDSNAKTGILDVKISDCLYKLKGGCGADSLHPYYNGIDLPKEDFLGYNVRAWFIGHLYPEKSTGKLLNLDILKEKGITDVFLNEPEKYL